MRKLLGLLTLVPLLTCTDRELIAPTQPGPAALISDGVHSSGNAHFFFLPPLVSAPTTSGTFDPSLSPAVRICTLGPSGCLTPLVAEFTTTTGPGSETVRVNATDQNYLVNWRTDQFPLDPAKTYRIEVLVAGSLLGFADVDVVPSAREAKNAQTGQFIPLVNGTTLPIKFRIEVGAVFVVGPSGGELSAQGGLVTLAVPDGALTLPIGITVAPSSDFPVDPGIVPGAEYLFGPEGTQFAKPVKLQIAYNPSNIPSGVGEAELRLQKVVGSEWVEVFGSEVDIVGHAVIGDITSFSQYGVVKGKKVGSVEVSPGAATVVAGCTVQFVATVYDLSGNPISRPVNWSSDNTAVARVDQTGLVTGIAPGVAVITGSSQQQSTTAQVTVMAAAPGQTGPCILIDATALTGSRLNLLGVQEFPAGTSTPVAVRLVPGTYGISDIVGSASFSVTTAGTIDYAPELDPVLNGRGTSQLTVLGIPITIDATALTGSRLNLGNVHEYATGTSVPVTARLLPGIYGVSDIVGSTSFTVMAAGTIDYAPELDAVLNGRGTSQLTVLGIPITIDATALTGSRLNLGNVHEYATGTSVPVIARLLPGTYGISDIVGSANFTVMAAGTIDYAPDLDAVLNGRGTSQLTVLGIPITIDATALGVPLFGIGGIGTFLAGSVQSIRFLPGTQSFGSSALSFPFVVNADVTVDYDPSLDARVFGRGTNTLTVR